MTKSLKPKSETKTRSLQQQKKTSFEATKFLRGKHQGSISNLSHYAQIE